MSSCCRKNAVDRGSPVIAAMRLPISDDRAYASFPHTPRVSIAKGTQEFATESSAYLVRFLFSAAIAADPAIKEVWRTCDGARVSGQVKSQTKALPLDQGIIVTPSGRFPSPLSIPVGSRMVGVFALRNARAMTSLAKECRR